MDDTLIVWGGEFGRAIERAELEEKTDMELAMRWAIEGRAENFRQWKQSQAAAEYQR